MTTWRRETRFLAEVGRAHRLLKDWDDFQDSPQQLTADDLAEISGDTGISVKALRRAVKTHWQFT